MKDREREREGRETELAIWKTASFPPLRSSPLLPSRHLSHAPEPSLQLPGSFPNSPEVRAVCVCMRACVCVCQVCEIRSLRARVLYEYLTRDQYFPCVCLPPLLSAQQQRQLRWACGPSDPLSPTLPPSLPLRSSDRGAMDGLRLPPLIEEALDSTGLCAAVLSVCVHLRLRVAGYSRVAVFCTTDYIDSDQPGKR